MKEYPSISRDIVTSFDIYAFDKLDGSQIRAEWDPKKGFWKFGTRTQLIDRNTPLWGEAVALVTNGYGGQLHEILRHERFPKAICFFEFFGRKSFAGVHQDEEHFVRLFDISVHKKGLLPPNEFRRLTRDEVLTASLLYHGKANDDFVEDVENGILQGMTFEGVVCKSVQMKTPGVPWMFKVKSRAWISRLKEFCSNDEKRFQSLL